MAVSPSLISGPLSWELLPWKPLLCVPLPWAPGELLVLGFAGMCFPTGWEDSVLPAEI